MTDRSFNSLFAALEAAVRAGDRARAVALEREIAQRLARSSAQAQAQGRRLRELMARLDAPAPAPLGEGRDDTIRLDLDEFTPFELSPQRGGAEAEGVDMPVWFATDRKPAPQGGFSGERAGATTRGKAIVHIPRSHRFGETGSSFWRRLVRGDDRLRLRSLETQTPDAYSAGVRETIEAARAAGDAPQALVFLHGFNVTFEDAAIRAAQIGCDLKIPGPVAFFSWPSRGSALAYPADEATIEASEGRIADFLIEFASLCAVGGTPARLHVIAHSMGNRGLMRALQRIAADATRRAALRFDQIILAAPDIDRDVFLDLAGVFPAYGQRTTLYASGADLPVHLSASLHDAPRAGYFTPYTVAPGVDTVAVPDFDIDLLGHSYFAQAAALLHDMFDLMHLSDPHPRKRQRLSAAQEGGASFWSLRA